MEKRIKYDVAFRSYNSSHVEEVEFKNRPEKGDKIKSKYYPNVEFSIIGETGMFLSSMIVAEYEGYV